MSTVSGSLSVETRRVGEGFQTVFGMGSLLARSTVRRHWVLGCPGPLCLAGET
jgi:hypothetical protein